MICDSYLIPKQTINNVMSGVLKNGYICDSAENGIGRGKEFVLCFID